MAPFNNGSGGTISGVTNREDWTAAVLRFLQIQQSNPARNPNSVRNLVITANTEGAISGSFSCPVTVAPGAGGILTITAVSYLVGVVYTAPTGGDSSAANEVQALIETVMRQKALELNTLTNPTNANHLSWGVTMGVTGVGTTNATITIGFSGLPVDMVQAASGGSVTIEGRTYLT